MDTLLRGGRVIDTSGPEVVDRAADVRIRDGRIAEVGPRLAAPAGGRVIDVADLLVCPGLVDLHVHFREPGFEYKEDIASGARSAVAGGFTAVCCMPNTQPVNDCRAVTDLIVRRSAEAGLARVYPIGAISRGLAGRELSEMGEMREAVIVAVSDDGRPVMNAGLMRRALEYARTFDLTVVQHAEDLDLAESGAMNEGAIATRLGLPGQPDQAESVMVARDIELTVLTGARYHVAHLSAARSVELVREAKRRGLPVTCEVTPHHFTLTHEACAHYDTDTKVMPPLRTEADIAILKEGMADGTIDCIATDHAPHSDVEKEVEFTCAAPGMLGLETAVPLTLALVREGVIDLTRAVHMLTAAPAAIFDLDRGGVGSLRPGGPADVCVIDVNRRFVIDRADMRSRSRNTPFHGLEVQGDCVLTLVGGRVVYDSEERTR
ncbi:MAG: dihydroorotase [Myxococcota bacterium]